MLPSAPGLLSTSTGTLASWLMLLASMRAIVSVALPAGNGATSVIGRAGKGFASWADAGAPIVDTSIAQTRAEVKPLRIVWPAFVRLPFSLIMSRSRIPDYVASRGPASTPPNIHLYMR